MDGSRFDALARSLTTARSRRRALTGLVGGTLSLLGVAEIAGRHKKKKKRHSSSPPPSPPPPPSPTCTPNCAGKVCGDDGCGGSCGVACTGGNTCHNGTCVCFPGTTACPANQVCLSNGTCATVCQTDGNCNADCTCNGFPSAEGPRYCTADTTCGDVPQVCTTANDCPRGQACQGTNCDGIPSDVKRCVPLCGG
jgi:hypothetical protein